MSHRSSEGSHLNVGRSCSMADNWNAYQLDQFLWLWFYLDFPRTRIFPLVMLCFFFFSFSFLSYFPIGFKALKSVFHGWFMSMYDKCMQCCEMVGLQLIIINEKIKIIINYQKKKCFPYWVSSFKDNTKLTRNIIGWKYLLWKLCSHFHMISKKEKTFDYFFFYCMYYEYVGTDFSI